MLTDIKNAEVAKGVSEPMYVSRQTHNLFSTLGELQKGYIINSELDSGAFNIHVQDVE